MGVMAKMGVDYVTPNANEYSCFSATQPHLIRNQVPNSCAAQSEYTCIPCTSNKIGGVNCNGVCMYYICIVLYISYTTYVGTFV